MVAVRWYLRYGLSYRDVEELLAERGIKVDHVTVYRWLPRFTSLLADVIGVPRATRANVQGSRCLSRKPVWVSICRLVRTSLWFVGWRVAERFVVGVNVRRLTPLRGRGLKRRCRAGTWRAGRAAASHRVAEAVAATGRWPASSLRPIASG